jgi:hypothetical protein
MIFYFQYVLRKKGPRFTREVLHIHHNLQCNSNFKTPSNNAGSLFVHCPLPLKNNSVLLFSPRVCLGGNAFASYFQTRSMYPTASLRASYPAHLELLHLVIAI